LDTPERDGDRLIPPGEAARRFGVHSKTLLRWRRAGLIGGQTTLGGQNRYWESEVRARAAERAKAVA
jgi:predicted site-specific integrase-resolvase